MLPERRALISGIGDYGGFTHFDLNRPDPLGSHANPHFGNTNGVTGAWLKQDLIVRVGTLFGHQPGARTISYSEDGGRSWNMCATVPVEKARNGHIAISADGSSWIWTPDRSTAFLTRDKGNSWMSCQGLPENIRVIADKVNPKRFYAVDAVAGLLYSSEDGGATFHTDTLQLAVKTLRRGNASLTNRRGDRAEGKTVFIRLPVVREICGLPLTMACTIPLPVRDLIFVRWTKSVLSMPSGLARQSRAVTIRPFI